MFALQMFENAVSLDPGFALAHAGLANVCAQYYYHFERQQHWIDRAIAATQKASAKGHDAPEIQLAEAWVLFAEGRYLEAADKIRTSLSRIDIDGGTTCSRSQALCRRTIQEVWTSGEAWRHGGKLPHGVPIHNSLGAWVRKML